MSLINGTVTGSGAPNPGALPAARRSGLPARPAGAAVAAPAQVSAQVAVQAASASAEGATVRRLPTAQPGPGALFLYSLSAQEEASGRTGGHIDLKV